MSSVAMLSFIFTNLIVGIITYTVGFVSGRRTFYDGEMQVDLRDMEKDIFSINMRTPLEHVPSKKSILLKVEVLK